MTAVYAMTYVIQAVMSVAGKGEKIITKASQIPEIFVTTMEYARED
jgi:formate-dependent phosphoribosylglycinamide formyltransferase (GAR transformylase)